MFQEDIKIKGMNVKEGLLGSLIDSFDGRRKRWGCMFKLLDYSEWKEYDGFSEGSGRSEKVWLVSPSDINAEIGLI